MRSMLDSPPRECDVCHRRPSQAQPVLQYVEMRPGGTWAPYKAHQDCVGSDIITSPKPITSRKRKWVVKRRGAAHGD